MLYYYCPFYLYAKIIIYEDREMVLMVEVLELILKIVTAGFT